MIDVWLGDLAAARAVAVLVPVDATVTAVTRPARRVHVQAGESVLERCRQLGDLPVGSAVLTEAGEFPSEFLIHLVVRTGEDPVSVDSIARALLNGLRRANEWGVESIAVPVLGTGAANLDAERAAQVMVPVLAAHVRETSQPSRVLIVAETEYELSAVERALDRTRKAEPDRVLDPSSTRPPLPGL